MKTWHSYLLITVLFFVHIVLYIVTGMPLPLLLCAAIMVFTHAKSSPLLIGYVCLLNCFDYFLANDQFGTPLIYLVPTALLAQLWLPLLLPTAKRVLPYALFILAFSLRHLAVKPLESGPYATLSYTFLPFCAILPILYGLLIIGSEHHTEL